MGRVNLVVGRNNVGKTTFLEAIHLYASPNALYTAIQLLRRRHEYAVAQNDDHVVLNGLFYRNGESLTQIEIGEINDQKKLSLHSMWRSPEKDVHSGQYHYSNDPGETGDATEVLMEQRGSGSRRFIDLQANRTLTMPTVTHRYSDRHTCLFLFATDLGEEEKLDSAELWDRVVIADNEQAVVDILRLIEPDLERIVMVQGRSSGRFAMAKRSHQKPIPLRSLGDGMNRLFELALGLVNVEEGGVFLVDEIDSGLHFTTLVDVWRIIFDAAARLNVQVFATTHSWECIEAFQKATTAYPAAGVLIRLERGPEGIRAESFSEEELAIITRESIEVR